MRKTQMYIKKTVYFGLPTLDLSKTVIYEFWYDYLKPIHGEKAKLRYMDPDSFIAHIKPDDIYEDIAEDVKKWFDTLNYELFRSLLKENTKESNWNNER